LIIVLKQNFDLLYQHVSTTSADKQHPASAADVVQTFEPDTASVSDTRNKTAESQNAKTHQLESYFSFRIGSRNLIRAQK
jgi:hypothetical protein